MLLKITGVLLSSFLSFSLIAGDLEVGKVPPELTLDGKKGGLVQGGKWSSSSIKGKVFSLFYVDPDESELNDAAVKALSASKFPNDKYQSIAVINMDATWLPNIAIEKKLEDKQKQYKQTIYIKDFKKEFVKKWNLKDDSSNILIFGKDGKLLYIFKGKLDAKEIETMLGAIKNNL